MEAGAHDDPADGLLIWALIEDGQVGAAREVATRSCGDESTAMECGPMTFVEAAEGRAPRVFERLNRYRREIEEGVYAPGKTSWELNDHFLAAELFAMVGESDSAFMYLDEAYVGGSPFLARFRVDPHFKNLRNDARFRKSCLTHWPSSARKLEVSGRVHCGETCLISCCRLEYAHLQLTDFEGPTPPHPPEMDSLIPELKMVERSRTTHVTPWQIGTLYTRAGDTEQAIEFLEKAFETRERNMPYLSVDPIFDYMRDDPRFQDLLRRMNLPR